MSNSVPNLWSVSVFHVYLQTTLWPIAFSRRSCTDTSIHSQVHLLQGRWPSSCRGDGASLFLFWNPGGRLWGSWPGECCVNGHGECSSCLCNTATVLWWDLWVGVSAPAKVLLTLSSSRQTFEGMSLQMIPAPNFEASSQGLGHCSTEKLAQCTPSEFLFCRSCKC